METQKGLSARKGFYCQKLVKDIRHNKELIAEIDDELRKLIPLTGYKLHTMPGIDLVTEAQIISEIGDINRFPDSDKLARFMGLAPVQFSSAERVKTKDAGNGNRALNAIFHFLAIQMVAVSASGKPRHPVFREYFEQRSKRARTSHRRLCAWQGGL